MPSIVTRYANQTVTLKRRQRDDDDEVLGDDWSGNAYEDAEDIVVRYEPKEGLVTTATGDSTQVESSVLTETAVRPYDLVEGQEVKRVEAIVNKRGVTLGYQVFL
jgi:hypothetical protein